MDIQEMLSRVSPDMMLQARRLMNTRAGREMIKEMEEKGIDQNVMQNILKVEETVKVLIIRPNGIVKYKNIKNTECPLNGTTPTKIIKGNYTVWYDANIKHVNKKATKWLNMNVGGMIIVMGDELDKIDFNI